MIRTDLIASWRSATPPDAPDRFVINIQPDQAEAFRQTLTNAGVTKFDWYPMIRGRLTTINELRGAVAQKHRAAAGCPITTGIFSWMAAHAAAERIVNDQARIFAKASRRFRAVLIIDRKSVV